MGIRYKDLEDNGLEDTVREITEDEMYNGLPSGYDTVQRTSSYVPDDVPGRGDYSTGDASHMNEADWNTLQGYKSQWQKAYEAGDQAGMDAAHQAAQRLRYKYGYSGGADGSGYNTIVADVSSLKNMDGSGLGGYGGYGGYGSGSGWPTYNNKYQERIDALTDAILGRDPFSYNKDTDPLYQQYKDSYTRGAQRSMQDTLAQLSARTGGLASSYAGSASQQAYNNYMAQLADKVPELYQLAYSMYQDNLDNQRTDLNMLMGLESSDYSKYLDQLSQYNTDRAFNYGVSRDQVADSQWQKQFDYNASRDAVEDARYDQEWAYQLMQDAAKQAISSGSSSGGSSSGGSKSGSNSGTANMSFTTAKKYAENGIFNDDVLNVFYKNGWTDDLIAAEYGYKPSGTGKVIKDVSDLGEMARNIANSISRSYGDVAQRAEIIGRALDKGTITEEEADFLLRAIGY